MVIVLLSAIPFSGHGQQLSLVEHLELEATQLDLRGTGAIDEDLRGLEGSAFENVTSVLLAGTQIGDRGLAFVQSLRIKQLDLNGTAITDAGLVYIGALPIEHLDLTGTAVTDIGMAQLRTLSLTVLVLRNTRVTGRGLGTLGSHNLKLLDLSYTHNGDNDLVPLDSFQRIEILNLRDTMVTDQGLRYLAQVKGLSAVYLAGTGVTSAGVAALQRSRPDLRVFTTPLSR